MNISVLLSVYNGENHIEELLNSLILQNFRPFKVLIRDDGSIDNTINIIKDFQKTNPEIIYILEDNKGNMGPRDSFFELLKYSSGSYFFYCDQDDVWDPQKIRKLTNRIKEIEETNQSSPVLVFSDMEIIDEKGELAYDSFFKLSKHKNSFHLNILFKGFIPGCATAFNKEAKELVLGYKNLMGHDGFTFMMVNLFGIVSKLPEKLIKYRVHSKNTVGLGKKQNKLILLKDLIKYIFSPEKYRSIILRNYFEQVALVRNDINNQKLYKKEFYTKDEVDKLSIIKRKKWFLKHFIPFNRGFFDGLVALLLI